MSCPSMSCPSVLIVEDEPIVAIDLARMVLETGSGLCGTAASGFKALALAELNPPVVALVDIRLIGRMDGIELARRLHGRFGTLSIFVTADPVETIRARIAFPWPTRGLVWLAEVMPASLLAGLLSGYRGRPA